MYSCTCAVEQRERGRHVPGVDDLRRGAGVARRRARDRRRVGAAPDRARLRHRRARRNGDDRASGRLGRPREHHPRGAGRRRCCTSSTVTSGSAPIRPCDVFLVLAQARAGLSCFLVERGPGMEFQRLKDKLGTRSLPSSEVEFHGIHGRLVGEEGRGVPAIIRMVNHTRLDCLLGGATGLRRGTVEAIHHARHRSAFGALLSSSRRCATCSRTSRSSPRRRPWPRSASRAPTTIPPTRRSAGSRPP